jgi:hypothetical protein
VFDFDSIDQWGPSLLRHLSAIVPETAFAFLRERRPKYFEEYRDLLFRAPGIKPREIIAATGDWLRSQSVIAYHGSRLTPEEIQMIQSEGLRPLEARSRTARLGLILARHPNWSNISDCFHEVVDTFGAPLMGGGSLAFLGSAVWCSLSLRKKVRPRAVSSSRPCRQEPRQTADV